MRPPTMLKQKRGYYPQARCPRARGSSSLWVQVRLARDRVFVFLFLFFPFQVLGPLLRAITLALRDEAVKSLVIFHMLALDERGVDRIAEDVL